MKKFLLVLLTCSLFVSGCSFETNKNNSNNHTSSSKVDIYVSDDVDVFGNKIDKNQSIENKTPSKSEEIKEDNNTEPTEAISSELKVYFFDVGQADSILLQIGEDENILIDGGNADDGDTLLTYFNELGVTHLDTIVATHPHEDHIGGLVDVMDNISTDKIYMPYIKDEDIPTTVIYKKFLNSINENEVIPIQSQNGEKIYESEYACLEIISPDDFDASDLNDYSVVTKLTYGDNSFIFDGDASSEINNKIIDNYSDEFLDVDVLKVGHHGSYTSTNEEWLKKLSPQYAVIMCGENNEYGHPHKEVVDMLEENNITIYRTDIDKTILMTSDGTTISVTTGI